MEIIRVNNVKKYYGKGDSIVKAIDGIELVIKKGFLVITGRAGSGKSTLLNLLGGLTRPTSGSVVIDDFDLSSLDEEQLTIYRRKNIGFVFKSNNLVPILKVYDNIVLPLELDGGKIDYEYIERIISMLEIQDKIYDYGYQLSDGQQQRVAIARALSTKPKIILADEPTGRLDSKTSRDVIGILKMTCKEFNQAVVVATHDRMIAEKVGTRIYIEDGKINEIQERGY